MIAPYGARQLNPLYAEESDARAALEKEAAGLPAVECLEEQAWRGTPRLTQRPQALALERLFRIGDAAGYVEPFTGEGIAWALASGLAVAPLVREAAAEWRDSLVTRWETTYHRVIGRRQRLCRGLRSLLHLGRVLPLALTALSALPGLAAPLVRSVNREILPGEGVSSKWA